MDIQGLSIHEARIIEEALTTEKQLMANYQGESNMTRRFAERRIEDINRIQLKLTVAINQESARLHGSD